MDIDKTTLNHKFEIAGDYEWKSRPATQQELDAARKDSEKGEWMVLGRSCWVCNSAHVHLIKEPNINCFACGRYYHYGIDLMDYTGSELEEFTHIKTSFDPQPDTKGEE